MHIRRKGSTEFGNETGQDGRRLMDISAEHASSDTRGKGRAFMRDGREITR